MTSLMDSKPVFAQRLATVGVLPAVIALFAAKGVDTMSKMAFCTNYNPSMVDDANLVAYFQSVVDPGGQALDARTDGLLASLRMVFFEAHTLFLASLRDRVDRKEDDLPKRVPQPERNERLITQRAKLIGVPVSGPLEPAYCLIDLVSQQKDDDVLRYIPPSACHSREQELRVSTSVKKEPADTSSDLKVRQCLQRRALAYDQMDLFSYEALEGWHTFLFHLMSREPLTGYREISLEQVLQADKQAFIAMSDLCRSGLGRNGVGDRKPEVALIQIRLDPMVMTLLNPLPRGNAQPRPASEPKGSKGHSKGAKIPGFIRDIAKPSKGKGKGKGKQNLPRAMIGMHGKTEAGEAICYGFNLAGCAACSPGARCPKGFHVCAKCLGNHSLNQCTS
jgi:hypothetical protein